LRAHPGGLRSPAKSRYEKYATINQATGQPTGFNTPTGTIEIFSTIFANAGYAPLPDINLAEERDDEYPLTLTFFRDIHFCDEQHRNVRRLRKAVPEPFVEVHPDTAKAHNIRDGDWIYVESDVGKAKLRAKLNASLSAEVVATVYGWWQSCPEVKASAYDPYRSEGANTNLLISNSDRDKLSASVAHRAQKCRLLVGK
jgi:anaerobic selenocysteine-containing dehydrogenase